MNRSFRDAVLEQLESDILYFAWLKQMAEHQFGFTGGAESQNAVLDLILNLVGANICVVGDAKEEDSLVVIHAWEERGARLRERLEQSLELLPPEDRSYVFWLQLSTHHQREKPNKPPQPTTDSSAVSRG